jgi:hypothetical protein
MTYWITPEFLERMRVLREQRTPGKAAAYQLGISLSTFYRVAREHGIKKPLSGSRTALDKRNAKRRERERAK